MRLLALVGLLLMTMTGPACAGVIDPALYCSAGSDQSVNSDTSAYGLAVSDVTLAVAGPAVVASDCYGRYGTGPNDPATETAALDAIWGPGFAYLDSTSAPASPTGLDGIVFAVAAISASSGTWTIAWQDVNGPVPNNLPLVADLAVELNGGNYDATYLFRDVVLSDGPYYGGGTFDIQFNNNGGQQPAISHLLLAGGAAPSPVSEPATLAMFGMGLVNLGLIQRRRRLRRAAGRE